MSVAERERWMLMKTRRAELTESEGEMRGVSAGKRQPRRTNK